MKPPTGNSLERNDSSDRVDGRLKISDAIRQQNEQGHL